MIQISKDVASYTLMIYHYKAYMMDYIRDNPRCDTKQLMRSVQDHFGDQYSFGFFLLAGTELVYDDDIIRHTDDTYNIHPRITSDAIDITPEENDKNE